MNELTILLSPSPNAPKADFLATVEPLSIDSNGEDLPFEITLDAYTRDPWSVAASSNGSKEWHNIWLKSIDGKKRLPGFTKYLRERRKAAYGAFDSPHPDEVTGRSTRGIFVVPFDPPTPPSKEILEKEVTNAEDLIYVKYALDRNKVIRQQQSHHGSGKQKNLSISKTNQRAPQPTIKKQTTNLPPNSSKENNGSSGSKARGGGGLLGNLLGAQRRTNHHLDTVPSKKKEEASSSSNPASNEQTSGQVIASFRTEIEQKLLDFQSNQSENILKIPITLSDHTRSITSLTEKAKITMDVLKYIIYEQAEEINEEWVAAKEQSEFMDVATIAIYKPGHVPPEVLEDMNQGELPEEVRQQQRAMREAMNREAQKKIKMEEEKNLRVATRGDAVDFDSQMETLNSNKRDRRTIEEIQRDMIDGNKRVKM